MRRLFALLLVLLLAGCGAPEEEAGCIPLPVTEESIREVYSGEQQTILEITPYEGDFLVETGPSDSPSFDWVFGATGLRRRLLFSMEGIREYEILYTGAIQFVTDGVSSFNGYRDFPWEGTASFDGKWDEEGYAASYDLYASGERAGSGIYWAPLTEPAAFGMTGRSEAVLDACVDIAGLEMLFGPVYGKDFTAAYCAPPGVEIACDGTWMTVTCRDTYLDCMALAEGEPENLEFLQQLGTLYPDSFPEGTLPDTNRFISQAEITQEGSDTVVRLALTEAAGQYTVETGSLGPHDSRPYFRLVFRERT